MSRRPMNRVRRARDQAPLRSAPPLFARAVTRILDHPLADRRDLELACGHRRLWPSDAIPVALGALRTCIPCGLAELAQPAAEAVA